MTGVVPNLRAFYSGTKINKAVLVELPTTEASQRSLLGFVDRKIVSHPYAINDSRPVFIHSASSSDQDGNCHSNLRSSTLWLTSC